MFFPCAKASSTSTSTSQRRFTTIHANDIREQVEAIYAQNRYWPEPLIQINPSYKRSTDISKLVDHHVLDPRCAEIFQSKGSPLSLYKHQEQAIALATSGESFVVTTGTGSGKSPCFFIPIGNQVLKSRRDDGSKKTSAIIVPQPETKGGTETQTVAWPGGQAGLTASDDEHVTRIEFLRTTAPSLLSVAGTQQPHRL